MLRRNLPDWKDEADVAKLVDQILSEFELACRSFEALADEEPLCNEPPTLDDLVIRFVRAEGAAVEAAQHGDVAPLAALLQDANLNWLQRETRALMAEVMLGKRKTRGRPKKTVDAKLANPKHRAGRDVQVVEEKLRRLYPKIPSRKVRARTIRIVAKRANITIESLQRYLDRSRNDPHRLSTH